MFEAARYAQAVITRFSASAKSRRKARPEPTMIASAERAASHRVAKGTVRVLIELTRRLHRVETAVAITRHIEVYRTYLDE
jgi:hypothetical protein